MKKSEMYNKKNKSVRIKIFIQAQKNKKNRKKRPPSPADKTGDFLEKQIFDWICGQLRPLIPQDIQILPLYSKAERDTDLVKIGISPAGVCYIGTPFRVCDLTLAAGVRREIPDPESRLSELWRPVRDWLADGWRTVVPLTGGQLDAILPMEKEPPAEGVDDSDRFLVKTLTAKIYFTLSTQNTGD